jgi:hypothetical protein
LNEQAEDKQRLLDFAAVADVNEVFAKAWKIYS